MTQAKRCSSAPTHAPRSSSHEPQHNERLGEIRTCPPLPVHAFHQPHPPLRGVQKQIKARRLKGRRSSAPPLPPAGTAKRGTRAQVEVTLRRRVLAVVAATLQCDPDASGAALLQTALDPNNEVIVLTPETLACHALFALQTAASSLQAKSIMITPGAEAPLCVSSMLGNILLSTVSAMRTVVEFSADGVLFEDGAQKERIDDVVEQHRRRLFAAEADEQTVNLYRHSRAADLRSRQKYMELDIKTRAQFALWLKGVVLREALQEQQHRAFLSLLQREGWANLTIYHRSIETWHGRYLTVRAYVKEEIKRLIHSELEERVSIIKAEQRHMGNVQTAEVLNRHKSAELDRERKKLYRKEQFEVSSVQLHERHLIIRTEVEDFKTLLKHESQCLTILREEERIRTRAQREEEARILAEKLASEEQAREAEREQLLEKRRRVQEREAIIRQERVENSEMSMNEERQRVDIYKQWDKELRDAEIAELRGNRRREKVRFEGLPPSVQLLRCEGRVHYYCTGQNLTKQVFPNAVLKVVQTPLSYHNATDYCAEFDPETPSDWIKRKTRIRGGTVTFSLDMKDGSDFREGDSLDLIDGLTVPELKYDTASRTIEYEGNVIACIKNVEHYDVEKVADDLSAAPPILGNKINKILMQLSTGATSATVSKLLRMAAFKRATNAPTHNGRADQLKIHITASLQFTVPHNTEKGPPSPRRGIRANLAPDIAISAAQTHMDIHTLPSHFKCTTAGLLVTYTEGDGFCSFAGGVTMRPSPGVDSWDSYKMVIRFGGVRCQRDAMCVMRKTKMRDDAYVNALGKVALPPPPPQSNEEEFNVSEKRRLVLQGGRPMLAFQRETLLINADSPSFVSTSQCPVLTFQLTGHLTGAILTKFLHSLVFKNDSIDPVDGIRIVEFSLVDGDGNTEALRIGIDVVSEDTKTMICLGVETAVFRRVVGDYISLVQEAVPLQGAIRLAPEAIVVDIDTEDFHSGYFIVTVTKNTPQDVISIETDLIRVDGAQLFYKGNMFAVQEVLRSRTSFVLHVTFTKLASITGVQALVRGLVFYTEPPSAAEFAFSGRRATMCRDMDLDEVCAGSVRAGVREVEMTLVVEQAEPVTVKMNVNVCNALVSIPTSLQALVFIERSGAVRLSSRYDLAPDVSYYDHGWLTIEIVDGNEPKDFLELQIPDSNDLTLGPRKTLTYERDLIHSSTRAIVGSLLTEDTKITLKFRPDARESARRLRKKDVQGLLKLVSYQHKGDNPKLLNKTVRFLLDDGAGCPSVAFVHIAVQPVNDVTQILRQTSRPAVYRQHSVEDAAGYCPFEDCNLHDADTENFSGGYLAVEILSGQRGLDQLSILPPALQSRRNHDPLLILTNPDSELGFSPLQYGDHMIGHVQSNPNGIVIRFNDDCEQATINLVEHVMHIVQYTNISTKIRPSTMVLMCRVAPSEDGPDGNLEGKMRLAVQIAEPLLSVDEAAAAVIWRGAAVAVAPTMHISLPDRHKCLSVFITCRITDSGPGDLLGFKFDGSPFNLRLNGTRDIVSNSKLCGRITERTKTRMKINFVSDGGCTAKLVKGVLRCVSFHNTEVQFTRVKRRVEFVLHLQDSLPGVMVAELTVCEPGQPTDILIQHKCLEVHATAPLPLFADCCVADNYTEVFAKGAYLVVEVSNAGVHDTIDILLPYSGKHCKARTIDDTLLPLSDLRISADGWITDDIARIAHASGLNTGRIKIAFVNCKKSVLQMLLQYIVYACTDPNVTTEKTKGITVTIKSLFEHGVGTVQMNVTVTPSLISLPAEVRMGEQGYAEVMRGCALQVTDSFSSAQLHVRMVKGVGGVAVHHKGVELYVHDTLTNTQGVITFKDSSIYAVMSSLSTPSHLVIDFPHSEVSFIERFLHAVALRRVDVSKRRIRIPIVHLSIALSFRTFSDGSSGPNMSSHNVSVITK